MHFYSHRHSTYGNKRPLWVCGNKFTHFLERNSIHSSLTLGFILPTLNEKTTVPSGSLLPHHFATSFLISDSYCMGRTSASTSMINHLVQAVIGITYIIDRKYNLEKQSCSLNWDNTKSNQRFHFDKNSNMNIPLTFLTDDILKTMATSRKNYFVLNKEKARDNRDHFFIFEVSTIDENPLIYRYSYKKTTTYLTQK